MRYLNDLGWQVDAEPLEVKHLVIPRAFTGVYADYAALQARQGYPITEYGGMEATRYSFRVRNHPSGGENIVADLAMAPSGHQIFLRIMTMMLQMKRSRP